MAFNSIDFLIFLPIVLLIYYLLPQKIRYLWLLGASYYFYMCWNARYALLMLLSTVITFLSGLGMEHVKQREANPDKKIKLKKMIVAASFLLNLAILFYFKYFNFTMDLIYKAGQILNINFVVPTFDIILPVGISFYTFQALSYTMDIYRDEIYAEKNFFRYALFVSFFPQLVAGPIERSKNLLKQLGVSHNFQYEEAKEGLLLMLWGFFVKMVVADRIAILVDTIYGDILTYPGWYLIVATVLFAMQIYCDFSGYSTIAMGAAKMLGIQLMDNFSAPYLSTSVATFWRNWHISLTSWFKDYLYIPLGGSRKGTLRKYLNKITVFSVSGLWHGAQMSFVVWGVLNGLYQVIGEVTAPLRDRFVKAMHLNRNSIGHKMVQTIMTFVLVDFSWIFFRANNMAHAADIIRSIASADNFGILLNGELYSKCGMDEKNFLVLLLGIALVFFADYCKQCGVVVRKVILEQDRWFRILIIVLAVSLILLFGMWGPGFDQVSFIYFQF